MFIHSVRRGQRLLAWLILSVLSVVSIGASLAQDVFPVAYGSVITGTIAADGTQATYSFNGNAGDLITIQVIGITPGWQPSITLLNPAQQPLAANSNNPLFSSFTPSSGLVYRLQETGTHYIVVSGTAGDFFLTLTARPAVVSTPITLDTPVELVLPSTEPSQVLVFNTDPVMATTLLIDVNPFDLNAYVEVRNAIGQIVTVFQGNLDNACVSIGPGDEVHEVTIASAPETTGTVTITLSNAPCELGDVPSEVVASTPQFVPIAIEGVCAASSFQNVNIRSGPSTAYSVVSVLPARQPIQVTGRNEDGSWYAVQNSFVQGWVAARVVAITGPCEALPVVAPPALPAASPTPGLPVVTVVVTVVVPGTATATSVPGEGTPTAPVPTSTEVAPTATVEAPTATAEETATVTP